MEKIKYSISINNKFQSYVGTSWSWSYGCWISNYLCNQCLSLLTLWVRIPLRLCVLNTILCYIVCQWLAAGRWFLLVLRFIPPIKLTQLYVKEYKIQSNGKKRDKVEMPKTIHNACQVQRTDIFITSRRYLLHHSLSRVVVPATLHSISVNAHFTRFL